MMWPKIIRIGLIGCAVLLLSMKLPGLYQKIFEKSGQGTSMEYSAVLDDFIEVGRTYDTVKLREVAYGIGPDGTFYNDYDIKTVLPVSNYKQLAYEGRFPDSIRGIPVTVQMIEESLRFPLFLSVPGEHKPMLWMFESVTDRVQMTLPDDMFRIDEEGIHFINTARNRVLGENKEKSKLFNDALLAQGFLAPDKNIFGYVSTTKTQDDGYFITDSKDGFFHLKMVNGQPYCYKIPLPNGLKVIGMNCMIDPLYYGYVYDTDYNIYLLKRSDYGFFQLPIYDFSDRTRLMLCNENLFFFTYTLYNPGSVRYYVMDRDHNLLADTVTYSTPYAETPVGQREGYVFPVKTNYSQASFSNLKASWYPVGKFIWLNLALMLILLVMQLFQRRNMRHVFNYIDLAIVLVFGIYGFIGVLIFPNRT